MLHLFSFIEKLGEEEHSSDWDIGVTIKYKESDKEIKIETEQGYSHIEIDGEDLLIENELGMGHYDDEDISYFRIPIMDIISIKYFD